MRGLQMSVKDIKLGTKLELEVSDSYNKEKRFCYVSQLLEIVDNNNIVIAAPIKETRIAFIPNNTQINVIFNHPKHGVIAFEGILLSKDTQNNIAVFNVGISSEFQKVQRRNHYRLETMLDAKYCIFEENTPVSFDESFEENLVSCVTKNISGSGACIVTRNELKGGTHLFLRLYLREDLFIDTRCVVIRSLRYENLDITKFNTGVRFTGISKDSESKLIKYIYDKQKDLLKQKKH